MRLGISTASFFSRMLTEESLEYIGKNGIPIAEVFFDTLSEYTDDFAYKLKGISERYSIEIVSVHAMSMQFEPQLFSIGKRQRHDAWEIFESVLQSAKILNANKYVMHGQATLMGAVRNAHIDRIAPIIDELAELARGYGIALCWENVSWANFQRPDFSIELCKRIKSDNLRFTLDIKQALRSGYDPLEYLKAMGERLAHVHLCDYKRSKDGYASYALPFRGDYDFVHLVDVLRKNDYKGDLVIEVYSDLYQDISDVIECRKVAAKKIGLE